jgi:3'(2'), 5'-bisphosphate nucleotidase
VESTRASDHATARELAQRAGELLVTLRATADAPSPGALGDLGDRRAHELLIAELADRCPGDAVLSEEDPDPDTVPAAVHRLWIVDPLDGTREFREPGRNDWAVHVALAVDGELAAGAVALPARGELFATEPAPPVLGPRPDRPPRIVVSRSRPPEQARELAQTLGGELISMGSAGAKAMAVVRGEADIYAHSGGHHVWDSAAPVAVARAAGLHASRLDGAPLIYGAGSTWLPDLLICRPEIAAEVLAIVARPSR